MYILAKMAQLDNLTTSRNVVLLIWPGRAVHEAATA